MKSIELPSNIEAECIILGSMMGNVDCANEAIDRLHSSDFHGSRHQAIFNAMNHLYKENYSIEPESVYLQMEPIDKKNLAYLYELLRFDLQANIELYIDKIIEKSRLRKFILLANQSISDISQNKVRSDSFFSQFNKNLDLISSDLKDNSLKTPPQILDNYNDSNLNFLKYLEDIQEKRKKGISTLRGLPTGFETLDLLLSGLCPGHMIVMASRPGVGKTTLAINMMINLLKKNIPILFFSMEMTSDEVVGKLVSMISEVPYKKFDDGSLTGDEFQKIVPATSEIAKWPLFIEDQEDLNPTQIRTRIRRNIQNHGIKAIFLDYLTCISPDSKTNSREEGVRDISNSLRKMAKYFKIPFVVIAQENRDSEKSEGKLRPPKKSDLGQSGGIEQDAHSILMLRRRELQDPYDKPGIMTVHVVKNRFGELKQFELNFKKETGKIENTQCLQKILNSKE